MVSQKRVRDPIHDLIKFDSEKEVERILWEVVETPEFQRLRRIKQLGFSDFVYPGATHSRFSHSLGVFHTAKQLRDAIDGIQRDKLDSTAGNVAVAAALLHDVGHGPFSHAFDDAMKKRKFDRHEDRSAAIIRNGKVAELLRSVRADFPEQVATFVSNKYPINQYAAIVSSQFDADRLDYMRRDRFMTGTQGSSIDFTWLRENLEIDRINIGQDEEQVSEIDTLVVGQKAVHAAEAYVQSLFHLYQTVYLHKTTRGADKLFEALLGRLFRLVENGDIAKCGLPDTHTLVQFALDPNQLRLYLNLDDYVIWGSLNEMALGDDPQLADISERLIRRNLLKCYDLSSAVRSKVPEPENPHESDFRKRELLIEEFETRVWKSLELDGFFCDEDTWPRPLGDQARRDPYKRTRLEEGGELNKIHVVNRAGQLSELSEVSEVVNALRPFNAYRIYHSRENESVAKHIDSAIREIANGS